MGPDQEGQILNFRSSPRSSRISPLPLVSPDAEVPSDAADPLGEVDHIFEMRSRGMTYSVERQSDASTERARLQAEFSAVCSQRILPAMRAFLERLRMNGGDGLVEEHDGVEGAGIAPRVRIWMSLSGEIIGRPRHDQHPYLELDFDIAQQQVNVAEGDMWKGHGTSGPVGVWIASEITSDMVTESLIDVLRRAAVLPV